LARCSPDSNREIEQRLNQIQTQVQQLRDDVANDDRPAENDEPISEDHGTHAPGNAPSFEGLEAILVGNPDRSLETDPRFSQKEWEIGLDVIRDWEHLNWLFAVDSRPGAGQRRSKF
jgi:hypothetical protein